MSEKTQTPKTLEYTFYDFYQDIERIIIHQLTGEVLTVIDSSIVEERQNKAVKDLIKNKIRSAVAEIQTIASSQDSKDGKGWGQSIQFTK
jgi:hypothetical protein